MEPRRPGRPTAVPCHDGVSAKGRVPVSAMVNGKTVWKRHQDKGHHAAAAAFFQAKGEGTAVPTELMLATMRATLRAAASGSGNGG